MGKDKALDLINKEYVFQESESLLPTPDEIFAAFEEKFNVILLVIQFKPIKKFLLERGLDYLEENKYSGVEIRIVEGIVKLIGENMEEATTKESIDFTKEVVETWKNKRNSNMSNIFLN